MHILAIVAAVLGGLAVWYWRIQMLRDAGSDAIDMVGRIRGAHRRRKFSRQAEASVLGTVDDPALAAAIYLFAVAAEGEQTAKGVAKDTITRHIAAIARPDKLDETIAYAEWAARQVVDSRDCVRRFKPLWLETLQQQERAHLVAMAEDAIGPAPAPAQKLAHEALRASLAA